VIGREFKNIAIVGMAGEEEPQTQTRSYLVAYEPTDVVLLLFGDR